jgi:2-hydroxyacyl-CoA lyase 1
VRSADRLPFHVEQAVRYSINGRPGAVYLDVSGTVINSSVSEELVTFPPRCPEPPRPFAS